MQTEDIRQTRHKIRALERLIEQIVEIHDLEADEDVDIGVEKYGRLQDDLETHLYDVYEAMEAAIVESDEIRLPDGSVVELPNDPPELTTREAPPGRGGA